MATCSFCGAQSGPTGSEHRDPSGEDLSIPLTWVTSIENGRSLVYCDRCSRDHLRSIESKLDAEYW